MSKITLKSCDGECIEVDEAVALKSKTIANAIDENGTDDAIPIEGVKGNILKLVIEYCKKHVESNDSPTNEITEDLDYWETEFMKMEKTNLFGVLIAANYLKIKDLIDLSWQTFADNIKDKTPEEVRKDAQKMIQGTICCQVENCGADLSKAKYYRRRQKVCDMHSRAPSALVGGIMQRFCQQCTRFHVLKEFDEGKRTCRRLLALLKERRVKAKHDNQTNNYANIHSNQSNHTGDQDIVPHLVKSLVTQAREHKGKNLVGGEDIKHQERAAQKQFRVNDFDLNDIYIDSDDATYIERSSPPPTNPVTVRNSDSASSSNAHSLTDRITFKLFGKEPNDLPVALPEQILNWLDYTPTDMENYIRPGCVVLTIYLRQDEPSWEELCCDLSFSLRKLFDLSDDPLWTDGWIYLRVQNHIAFAFDGQVVLDTSLPLRSHDYSQIITVRPLAVTKKAKFTVKGINLHGPGTKLLCAVEGTYLVQEATQGVIEKRDDLKEENEIDFVEFSCEMPIASGRGFVEIEDHDGLSSSFFPFIVSEDEDVCSEIRKLESILEFTGTDSARQAMDFIHEIGWLLHRTELKSRLADSNPNQEDLFPLTRFKFLIEFSMDREWCAVIKMLLNILFEGGIIDLSPETVLSELYLLHRAVRKHSKPLVEMLLRFTPKKKNHTLTSIFRPDVAGPGGLTPLHIADGEDWSEDVLDALTEDPGKVGIQAWNICKDNTGFTPEDYARLRGHFSNIHLVQRKLNRKPINEGHVVVNILKVHTYFNIENDLTECLVFFFTWFQMCKIDQFE